MDFNAAYDALAAHQIGGALLDVFPHGCWTAPEMKCGPPFGAPTFPFSLSKDFRKLDNVVLTPYLMMSPYSFWDLSAEFVAANVQRLIEGKPLAGVVRNATAVNATETFFAIEETD